MSVSVQLVGRVFLPKVFREAIKAALAYKQNSTDFLDQVMRELEVSQTGRARPPYAGRLSNMNLLISLVLSAT